MNLTFKNFFFFNYEFKIIVYYDQLYSSQLQEKAQKRNLRIKKEKNWNCFYVKKIY